MQSHDCLMHVLRQISMISNLLKGLSKRVVQAVADRLRRAMAGGDDAHAAAACSS